jgi:hypothetical protein
VRSVVKDGQHAEGVALAAQERHCGEGVEPLLDHRGPERLRAWVVPVAHREERPPGCHRLGRQRRERGPAGRGEIAGREPAARFRAGRAVGPEQADRRAFRAEQAASVLHDAGQDPVDVQPARDVDRDPAQRIGAMELQRGRPPELVQVHGDRERAGDRRHELDPFRGHGSTFVGDEEHAPRSAGGAADGDRHATAQEASRAAQPVHPDLGGLGDRPGGTQGPGRQALRLRQRPQPVRPGTLRRSRDQSTVATLENRDQVVAGTVVQELHDRTRHGVGVGVLREQVGQVRQDRHVEPGPRRRLVQSL